MSKRNATGWIGVDAGASGVKVAQLVRREGRFEIASCGLSPRRDGDDSSICQELRSALAIANPAARKAAGVLSMQVSKLATGKATVSSTHDSPMVAAAWQADAAEASESWRQFAIDERAANQFCDDLLDARLACQTIDSLPHAVARAVELMRPAGAEAPVAGIDWGATGAMFVVAHRSRCVYARQLRGVGLRQLEAALTEELDLAPGETADVSARMEGAGADPDVVDLVRGLATPLVKQMRCELSRTMAHLASYHRGVAPRGVYLMGGGGLLGVEDKLAEAADVPVKRWGEGLADDAASNPARYAVAAAASALAWTRRYGRRSRREEVAQ